MAVTLIGGSGLFDVLGRIFYSQGVIHSAVGTTVPVDVANTIDMLTPIFANNLELARAIAPLGQSVLSWQGSEASLLQTLRQLASDYLVETYNSDSVLPQRTELEALKALINQLIGAGSIAAPDNDVDASTVSASVAAGSSNSGDGTMIVSTLRASGASQQNLLDETLVATCVRGGAGAQFRLVGEPGVEDKLSHLWPGGSGTDITLSALSSQGDLLSNGGFDSADDRANTPDNWIISTGTIGTTIGLTTVEVQTVTISGTPTSGYYWLTWTNLNSKVQTTAPIAYNATAEDVQAALRLLEGLESVTVTSTGSSPNYAHTVTFLGAGGNQSQLTSANNFDTGSIAHATTTGGTAEVYTGSYAVKITGDGSQLTQIRQLVNLAAGGVYAFGGLWITDSAPAAGVMTVDLWDGSAVIADDFGTNNSFTIDCTALTTSWAWKTGFFRMPRVLPPLVYLRIHVSTAITNTKKVFFDDCRLVSVSEAYANGFYPVIFEGRTPFADNDKFTITATNNRAGAFQEWFERNFDMRGKGFILPYDTGGTETIADSLIA